MANGYTTYYDLEFLTRNTSAGNGVMGFRGDGGYTIEGAVGGFYFANDDFRNYMRDPVDSNNTDFSILDTNKDPDIPYQFVQTDNGSEINIWMNKDSAGGSHLVDSTAESFLGSIGGTNIDRFQIANPEPILLKRLIVYSVALNDAESEALSNGTFPTFERRVKLLRTKTARLLRNLVRNIIN